MIRQASRHVPFLFRKETKGPFEDAVKGAQLCQYIMEIYIVNKHPT